MIKRQWNRKKLVSPVEDIYYRLRDYQERNIPFSDNHTRYEIKNEYEDNATICNALHERIKNLIKELEKQKEMLESCFYYHD